MKEGSMPNEQLKSVLKKKKKKEKKKKVYQLSCASRKLSAFCTDFNGNRNSLITSEIDF